MRVTEEPISMDRTGEKFEPLAFGTAASVDIFELLIGMLRELYCGKECLREPNQEVLKRIIKHVFVRQANTRN